MGSTFFDHLKDFFLGPSQPKKEEPVVVTAPAVIHHMDHAVKPFLDYVGKYKVHQDIKPHTGDRVILSP